jgi:hypothetical protein
MKVKIRPHTLSVETVYSVSLNGEPVGMIIRLSPIQWTLSLEGRATRNKRDVVESYDSLGEARAEVLRLTSGGARAKVKRRKAKASAQPKRRRSKRRS